MKYSIFTKFLAIVLCALSLVVCAAGITGIVLAEDNELYTANEPTDWITDTTKRVGYSIAYDYCTLYAAAHEGGCTREMIVGLHHIYQYDTDQPGWSAELYQNNVLLDQTGDIPKDATELTFTISPIYPAFIEDSIQFNAQDYTYVSYLDPDTQTYRDASLEFHYGAEYQVVMYLDHALIDEIAAEYEENHIEFLHQMRYNFIFILVGALLAAAAILVFLCHAAGRHPHSTDVYPVALNRIPLDLYAAIIAGAVFGLWWLLNYKLYLSADIFCNPGLTALGGVCIFFLSVLVVAFLCAFSAQMKTTGGLWWRKTVTFFLLSGLWLVLKWIGRGIRLMGRSIAAVVGILPLVWQWVGVALALMLLPPACYLFYITARDPVWNRVWAALFFSTPIIGLFLIGWWAWYMGQIIKGASIMGQGNLNHQIRTRCMPGKFRKFAESLNSMTEASRIAAEKQLRSERMKTELITNVSHDIKTPLTSIINYVDLLKKPHSEAQSAQYLEVLDRQSQRLKKLIVDLMEMSKASTGNVPVELIRMDAVEAVNQALGEFSDKLDAAGLEPVFHSTHESVMIMADGRLLWRVLSNLLGNAVKYAMPGTRMYLDLTTDPGNAVLSIKNISRDQLNVEAEELMERFVRGDASRNTEGSGLGLNIAKSLVELQKGRMHLTVDGDLFKVTITLPLAGK